MKESGNKGRSAGLKTIALTMGDPLGIGPEIVALTLADREVNKVCRPLAVGNRDIICLAASKLGLRNFEKRFGGNIVDVPLTLPDPDTAENAETRIGAGATAKEFVERYAGTVQGSAGKLAYDCIAKAHELCASGAAAAVATAPINKEALKAANVPYIGHTEIFGALTGTEDPLTMFETDGMRIFFLTRHVSLRSACGLVTEERLRDYIRRALKLLKQLGVKASEDKPLAVAGLNPHSGEHGLFGTEEVEIIAPAVEKARAEGAPVTGPIGADSVFHLAHTGKFSAVLSLYHDQGHIAAKTLDFERTISLTLGMPYLRTSVDHGTAFDIAWQKKASPVSMREAVLLAAKYSF
jgi:4-hydroxythreonine-4-phosphate dehydrogenase